MTLHWRLAYRLAVTPWERVGEGGSAKLAEAVSRLEPSRPPVGRVLDIGCGSGSHTVMLAHRGWDVVGVAVAPRAIERAKARAARAGADAAFVVADVSALSHIVEPGFSLVIDVGCFHALSDAKRGAYACAVQEVTDPTATLVMAAFRRNRRPRAGPRGVATEDVLRRFPAWTLQSEEPVQLTLPRGLRHLTPRLLTLRRDT